MENTAAAGIRLQNSRRFPPPSACVGVVFSVLIHAAADQAADTRRPPNARTVMQRGVAHAIVRTRWQSPADD